MASRSKAPGGKASGPLPCPRCLGTLAELVCASCGMDYSVLRGTKGFEETSSEPEAASEADDPLPFPDEPLPDGAAYDWGAKASEELSKGVLTGSMRIIGDGPEPPRRVSCLIDHTRFCCARHGTHTTPHRMCLMGSVRA